LCLLACLLICVSCVLQVLRDELRSLLVFAWLTTPVWAMQFFFVRSRIRRLMMETSPPKGFPVALMVVPTLTPVLPEPPAAKVFRFLQKRNALGSPPQRSDSSR
jgi:hypothetical protein